MKFNKIVSIVFVLLMIVLLTACGDTNQVKDEPVIGKVMEIDDCTIKITDVKLVDDIDGNPALAVSCDFTNGTDEATDFYWTVFSSYMQNDSELELALVYLDEENFIYMDDSATEDVEPGATKNVTSTYELIDTTTPVEVVMSDLMEDDLYKFTIDVASLK